MTETEIKFINELNDQVHPEIALWAQHLIESGQSVKQVKEAMQRMVDYIQRG